MLIQKTIFSLFLLCLLATSCKKEEGKGGTTTLSGNVFVNDYNSNGVLVASYFAPKENVYIIYGTAHTAIDDNTVTSYDGSYQFDKLYEGTYTIFAYSKCDTCLSGLRAEIQEITVPAKGKIIAVPTITIRK